MTKDAEFALQVADAADAYLAALERGEHVAPREFLSQFPAVESVLPDVLAAIDCIHDLADAAAPIQETADRTIGDYRILRELGRGGMGVVYEAQQVTLGRRVALKLLPLAGGLDSRQLARFRNEAQAAAQLHHPHIVPVYAIGQDRGMHFYAMQYIEGASLAELIAALVCERDSALDLGARPTNTSSPSAKAAETEPLAILSTLGESQGPNWHRTVARLGAEAADALQFAHDHGIVHRDIKPSNLLIDAGGRLWVTDFGLAQLPEGHQLTHTGDLLGTLRYMSPEQAAGRKVLDERTDIYSLGATLYELLALTPAFSQSARGELLRAVTSDEPTPLRKRNRSLPTELETIVLKAMAKEPAERYASARALREDLERYIEHRPIAARRPSLAMRLRKWCRRHRPIVATAVAVGVIATALGMALLAYEQRKTTAAYHELSREQGRTRAALTTANALRAKTERQYDLARRAVEHVRERQAAVYRVHQLEGRVTALPGGPAWLREVVNDDPAKYFLQIASITLEPAPGNHGLEFLRPLAELEQLDLRGKKGFRPAEEELGHLVRMHELTFLAILDIPLTGTHFPDLASFPNLETLALQETAWDDDTLGRMDFRKTPRLGSLAMGGTRITDAGTGGLQHLHQVFLLDLSQTQVGDQTLAKLAGLAQLKFLFLNSTRVTDDGLAHLQNLPSLADLYVNGCAVSDAGLEHLAAIPHLRTLGVAGTQVSQEGVKNLQAKLPELRIVWRTNSDDAAH